MRRHSRLVIALFATVVSFSTLYIPQPLLPLLAAQFSVSAGEAGLLMTAAMLPLAVAPVFYGYFLQAIPARSMLIGALALLSLNLLAFALVTEFWQLLGLRLLQGLLLPAIFTALMTYCAGQAPPAGVRRALGLYVGATILGGFAGRLAGGAFADLLDWRSAFVALGLAQLAPLVLLLRVESDAAIDFARLDRDSVRRVLRDRRFRGLLLVIGTVFFVFSGVLNNIPFRLAEIDPAASPLALSLLYLGYLVGVPISFASAAIARRFADERGGLYAGLALHAIGLVLMTRAGFGGLLATMFLLAGGFFLMHALLSGLANSLSREHKGVINGLYVSVYYLSGALGSWLPGYAYEGLGWTGLTLGLLALLAIAALAINGLGRGLSAR